MKNIILLLLISFSATCQSLTSQDSTKNLAPVQMKVLAPEVHMRNILKFQEKNAELVGIASLSLIGYALLSHYHGSQPPIVVGSAIVLGGAGIVQSIFHSNDIRKYREKHFPRKKK